MGADLAEKTDRYEQLLADALSSATVADGSDSRATGDATGGSSDGDAERGGEDCIEMARSYLEDGRHFREHDDLVNALAAFSYGHGWLDAGARLGALDVPSEGHLFTE